MKIFLTGFLALIVGIIFAASLSKSSTPSTATPRSGEKVYKKVCVQCHQSGTAGAPKVSDADAWQKRKTNREIDDLHQSVINGLRSMPPRGMCRNCSDEELKNAVMYMLERSQKEKKR